MLCAEYRSFCICLNVLNSLLVYRRVVYTSLFRCTWWRHQMENFLVILALCEGNSPVTSEFPSQRPMTRIFDVFFDLRWINGWVNIREAGDWRRHRAHHDVTVNDDNGPPHHQHHPFNYVSMTFSVYHNQCCNRGSLARNRANLSY